MGRGGIFTTASVIASDMFTLRERSMVQGVSAIFNTVGPCRGFHEPQKPLVIDV